MTSCIQFREENKAVLALPKNHDLCGPLAVGTSKESRTQHGALALPKNNDLCGPLALPRDNGVAGLRLCVRSMVCLWIRWIPRFHAWCYLAIAP